MHSERQAVPLLRDILVLHRRYAKHTALPSCLGDGYLQVNNSVCRNVRAAVVTAGYTFTSDDVGDYRVLPLAALDAFMKKKKIPYFATAPALERIERKRPRQFKLDEVVQPIENHVLHESAHCVAHTTLRRSVFDALPLSINRRLALRGLMGEACANATEALAWWDAEQREHAYFLRMNSYHPQHPELTTLRALTKDVERSVVFRTMFFAFLFANFLHQRLDDTDRARISVASGLDRYPKTIARKILLSLGDWALTLSVGFRLETTPFYLKYEHGIDEDVFRLLDFSFMNVIEKSAPLRAALENFVARTVK